MKKILTLICATVALSSCTTKQVSTNEVQTKSLILYYSQSNTTKQVAELLQTKIGADIDSIMPEQAYDGDFSQTIARCQQEFAEQAVPSIKPLSHDIAAYDTIYLGFPVWFGTYAQPIAGLLKSTDLSGKVIVPFCTFGSGGLNTSSDKLTEALPNAKIIEGYGVRQARIAKASLELDEYLIRSGIKNGEVELLADYSEQQPLSADDKALFDKACGSYPMPLGTPVSVGSRQTRNSIDYEFIVESPSADGTPTQAKILVSIGKTEGAEPEFIMAIR